MILGLFLLLALGGGYFFIRDWEMTSFVSLREDGHRLYFRSAVAGIAILIVLAFLVQILESVTALHVTGLAMNLGIPSETELFATASVLTLFLGKPSALALNYCMREMRTSKHRRIKKLPEIFGLGRSSDTWRREAILVDDFDALIFDATVHEFPLLLTMDTEKVYIGYVDSWPKPGSENEWITLLPMASGFRNGSLEVDLTTAYDDVLSGLANEESEHASIQELLAKYQVCICRDNIVSVGRFDFETFSTASLNAK